MSMLNTTLDEINGKRNKHLVLDQRTSLLLTMPKSS